jgi:hypothetical protein
MLSHQDSFEWMRPLVRRSLVVRGNYTFSSSSPQNIQIPPIPALDPLILSLSSAIRDSEATFTWLTSASSWSVLRFSIASDSHWQTWGPTNQTRGQPKSGAPRSTEGVTTGDHVSLSCRATQQVFLGKQKFPFIKPIHAIGRRPGPREANEITIGEDGGKLGTFFW